MTNVEARTRVEMTYRWCCEFWADAGWTLGCDLAPRFRPRV
jgi:hypothetical protein